MGCLFNKIERYFILIAILVGGYLIGVALFIALNH